MKRILLENGVNTHQIAIKEYALARRAKRVIGPPMLRVLICTGFDFFSQVRVWWSGQDLLGERHIRVHEGAQ